MEEAALFQHFLCNNWLRNQYQQQNIIILGKQFRFEHQICKISHLSNHKF